MIREVPLDRIKTLSSVCTISVAGAEATNIEQYMKNHLAVDMAVEIVNKLFEFNKIKRVTRGDGLVCYYADIDVIVPETPVKEAI